MSILKCYTVDSIGKNLKYSVLRVANVEPFGPTEFAKGKTAISQLSINRYFLRCCNDNF